VRFGKQTTTARRNYRQFVSEGIKTGHRDDFAGGGLKRCQGERLNNEYEIIMVARPASFYTLGQPMSARLQGVAKRF